MASTRLHRTPSSSSNQVKWTWSGWIKKSTNAASGCLFCAFTDVNNYTELDAGSNQIDYYNVTSGAVNARLTTSAYQRDPAAWYHIVVVWDSANATAGDRMKVYINGVEQTAFSATTDPSSSLNSTMNSTAPQEIGARALGTTTFFNGLMAHVHFCDGYAYAASDFGETDSTSGIWIAKTSPSVSYGTNGYFLKFQDNSAFGDDSSGNTNDFTLSGTMTQTKDTPDNNFATGNPLYFGGTSWSNPLINGNNTLVGSSSTNTYNTLFSTLAAHGKGKWYAEFKLTTSDANILAGIASPSTANSSQNTSKIFSSSYMAAGNGYGLSFADGIVYYQNSGSTGQSDISGTTAQNDIIGIYLDLDANKLYYAKNGTVLNSGTGIDITNDSYYFAAADGAQSAAAGGDMNFGNGYFGTTAVSSAVADAGGEGQFEYDPSAGTFDGSSKDFRALCTNNIATYG